MGSGGSRDVVPTAAAIGLNGGTLNFTATAAGSSEALGTTTLQLGQSNITVGGNAGTGADLVLGNLRFDPGFGAAKPAVVRINSNNGTLGNTVANPRLNLTQVNGVAPSAGFLGGWANVNGVDFAAYKTGALATASA